MSFDSVPSKSEVMGWDSHQLADFLKRRNLIGCDKVVARYNINGQRFLSMSENDIQKFPKLHAPLISKICQEINKEKKRFFPQIPTIRPSQPVPNYPQPPVSVDHEEQAWDSEEFLKWTKDCQDPKGTKGTVKVDSEDDYENPDSNGEDEASGGDYESPLDGSDSDNSYEPPPIEPSDDMPQICPVKPIENSDYIDNNRSRGVNRSQPPVPPERPGPGHGPGPFLPLVERPSFGLHAREEQAPKRNPAPRVDRSKKPGVLDRSHPSPVAGVRGSSSLDRVSQLPKSNSAAPLRLPAVAVEMPGDPMRIPKPSLPPSGVRRSASSVTPGYSQNRFTVNPDTRKTLLETRTLVPPVRSGNIAAGISPTLSTQHQLDHRNEFHDDTARHTSNTFPLHARNPSPRPPRTHGQSFQTDSVSSSRLLPAELQKATIAQRSSPRAALPQPDTGSSKQDMDPAWYVGKITRGEAESCLRRVNRDGAFLVRDSSNRSSNQPYTLVVLYQEKVYNIQIRRERDGFMLGTGLKGSETFERICDIISQHRHMPLLLIDAKNREASQQNQCALIYPAGY